MEFSSTEPRLSSYLHARACRSGTPLAGNFELTARCNFNCKMCYVHLTAEEQQTFHDCCDGIRKNMEHLKDLDAVAYVRFASVYREFKDVSTFMDELKKFMN